MDVEDPAHCLSIVLQQEYPDYLLAIGWYDDSYSNPVGNATQAPAIDSRIHEGYQFLSDDFERFERDDYERICRERLRAMVRFYDSVCTFDIPVTNRSGIVIVLTPDGGNELLDILNLDQTVMNVEL